MKNQNPLESCEAYPFCQISCSLQSLYRFSVCRISFSIPLPFQTQISFFLSHPVSLLLQGFFSSVLQSPFLQKQCFFSAHLFFSASYRGYFPIPLFLRSIRQPLPLN